MEVQKEQDEKFPSSKKCTIFACMILTNEWMEAKKLMPREMNA
jgi:hypothetical protein